MTRVFLDVNVSLDLIIDRKPFHEDALFLLEVESSHGVKLMISSASISILIYEVTKMKIRDANDAIWRFLEHCDIVNAYKSTISSALKSQFRDKEDASEYFTALDNHADFFLTRDIKDYRKSLSPILPVFTPVQFKDIIKDHTIFAS